MRIRDGYVISKVGSEYLVKPTKEEKKNFNGMIRLNSSAAFVWKSIRDGADTKEKLVREMTAYYEDLDDETALEYVEAFLENVGFALEE